MNKIIFYDNNIAFNFTLLNRLLLNYFSLIYVNSILLLFLILFYLNFNY